jgi:hypothetical protein
VSYQDKLKKHLVEYKRRHLGISESGVFLSGRGEVKHDHILPLGDADKNVLEEARKATSAFFAAHPNQRHQYFHHLNSSQAFAFNLFFPYFSSGPDVASALLRALGQERVFAKYVPEAVPVPVEESNIDMVWTTEDGAQTFCEVKLSEADFGKAADDIQHKTKLEETYGPILKLHLEPSRLERAAFFDAYQFNRNVWHMVRSDNNRLIFLLPRANTVLWSRLHKLLLGVVPLTQQRISVVAIEDVIDKLSADDGCPKELREYANKLKEKYVI